MVARTNKLRMHPPRVLMEIRVHHLGVVEGHSHLEVVGAAHQVAVEEVQMRVGAEHTLHMRRTASARGAVPFAVVGLSLPSLRARIGRLRGDLRSGLWRALLGFRLGR